VTTYQGSPESNAIIGRTPITGRPGRPGVWMAYPVGYPSATKLLLWKVGDGGTTTLTNTKDVDIQEVAITSDPDGRLAVLWTENGGNHRLLARVSNPDVTAWGPAFEIPRLKQPASTWAIEAAAQTGGLIDVVANYGENEGTPMRFWHTQVVAPPELAKAVNARVVSGVVLVKLPGSNSFVPLSHESQLPVGAIVDATRGRVRIVTALPGGKTQTADFFQGVFRVAQNRTGLATLALFGGSFNACGKAKRGATASKAISVRKLWGAGKGKFRTKGKYASATIRGTTWLTEDRCDGTLIRVTQGSVSVRDLEKKKTVVVTKGHSYLAKR
jgi:hypothetical protein